MCGWNVYSRWMRKVERRVNTPFRRQIPTSETTICQGSSFVQQEITPNFQRRCEERTSVANKCVSLLDRVGSHFVMITNSRLHGERAWQI